MIKSLRTRLTLWYVGVLVFVLILTSAGAYFGAERLLTQRMDTSLRSISDEVVQDLSTAGVREESTGQFVSRIVDGTRYSNRTLWVFDASGHLIAEKAATGHRKLRSPSPAKLVDFQEVPRFYQLKQSRANMDDGCRGIIQRVSDPRAGYIVVVAQSTEVIEDELELLRGVALFVVPLSALVAAAGGWFLARRSLDPIAAMANTAGQITANNLGERLPVHNPQDEIGSLATVFNNVLDRLVGALTQQRQFMADASHELRTPLSVIRTAAEVTLEPTTRKESEYREALGIVKQQVQRLTGTVEDMFALARAEMGQLKLHSADLYLDEVVGEAVTAASLLAARHLITIEAKICGEVPYRGDEGLCRQMLMNLLDNAIKFTARGGEIVVTLDETEDECVIQVADTGNGIPMEDQPFIFDRFFRADKSRTPRGTEGAGLGLAIARSIAELHHGKLLLAQSTSTGSTFRVSLPICR